jgi:hypothetical protein
MKHSSTRELFNYWNMRRGSRVAPERSDIEPGAIRRVLADTFMLTFDPRGGHPFRVAGTRVCALFGRELKGGTFAALWATEADKSVADLTATVAGEAVGAVAGASASGRSGAAAEVELLLLPLVERGGASIRLLGTLAPAKASSWLGAETLGPLTLGSPRYLGPLTGPLSMRRGQFAPSHARAFAPRIRHGLLVYDGGQA